MAGLAADVAAAIRLEAARVGVRQAELARVLGMSASAVSLRFRQRVPWTLSEIEAAAWYLNVPVSDLLDDRWRRRPRR